MDDLNLRIQSVGASALTGIEATFTVAADDDVTPTLVDCAIALRIYELRGEVKFLLTNGVASIGPKILALPPLSTSPELVLNLSAGLARSTNDAKLQALTVTFTEANLSALLGSTAISKAFRYFWVITPVGAPPLNAPIGGGYDGVFALIREGHNAESA